MMQLSIHFPGRLDDVINLYFTWHSFLNALKEIANQQV
jgi:hypothetical protein